MDMSTERLIRISDQQLCTKTEATWVCASSRCRNIDPLLPAWWITAGQIYCTFKAAAFCCIRGHRPGAHLHVQLRLPETRAMCPCPLELHVLRPCCQLP